MARHLNLRQHHFSDSLSVRQRRRGKQTGRDKLVTGLQAERDR